MAAHRALRRGLPIGFVLLDRLVLHIHSSVLVAVVMARFLGKAGTDLFLPEQPDAVRDNLVTVVLIVALGWIFIG